MASLTLGHSETMMGTPACFLVSPTTTTSAQYTYSSSSPQSTPTITSTHHRIAPKTANHQQKYHQQNHHHNQESSDLLHCKRRIQLGHFSPSIGKGPQPAAVARRNERERNRVRLVNLGFATLRQHVPNSTKNKKMSKVDTLKSAVEYIRKLQELLGEEGGVSNLSHMGDENSYPSLGGQSSTGSPTPSVCSEASSPYDGLNGGEEEELLDFAAWF